MTTDKYEVVCTECNKSNQVSLEGYEPEFEEVEFVITVNKGGTSLSVTLKDPKDADYVSQFNRRKLNDWLVDTALGSDFLRCENCGHEGARLVKNGQQREITYTEVKAISATDLLNNIIGQNMEDEED